jgi:uncharacterized membrane protein
MAIYYLKLYLVALGTFLAVDLLWLGLLARRFYSSHLGFLFTDRPVWSAAVFFYLLFVAGITVFIVVPNLESGSARRVLLLGALFGLVCYGTYDLTNLALIKNWPWIVTVVDMFWGALLAAVVSYVSFLVGRTLGWK